MRIAGWVGRHRGVVDPRPGLQSGAVPQRRPRPFGISPGGGEVGPALCCRVCADGACDRAGLRWWSAGNRLPQDRLPTGPPADLATGRRVNLEAAQCLHDCIRAWARTRPHAEAAVESGRRLDYAGLADAIDACAAAMIAAGVERGDRVATLAAPGLDFLVTFLATAAIGGIWVGLNPRHAEPGLRSEEHTSELQSLMRISYAVFCLKKKNTHTKQTTKQQR